MLTCLPQGVGVGLFRDRTCAVEACNKLSVSPYALNPTLFQQTLSFNNALSSPPPLKHTQGVGVGLFRGRACAVDACNKLSVYVYVF
jgi:hypothetical protein